MALPYVRTLTAPGISAACPLDHYANPFQVGIVVAVNTGPATYTVEYSNDSVALATDAIGTGMTWLPHAYLASKSATDSGNIAFPVRAVRLNVAALTAGSVVMTSRQAG